MSTNLVGPPTHTPGNLAQGQTFMPYEELAHTLGVDLANTGYVLGWAISSPVESLL